MIRRQNAKNISLNPEISYHSQTQKKSSLRGGTTKQSIMLITLPEKIASSAEKAFSQ